MGDLENKANEWKGEVKETVGDATDNEDLQAEGAVDKAKAKTAQAVENAKDTLEDAGQAAKEKAKSAFNR